MAGESTGRFKPLDEEPARAEVARRAIQLRLAGATYAEIATACGWAHKSGARRAIKVALKLTLREPAEELRKLEVARLDRLTLAYWNQAIGGDLKAAEYVLKLSRARAELLGLDAPKTLMIESAPKEYVEVTLADLCPPQAQLEAAPPDGRTPPGEPPAPSGRTNGLSF